MLLGNASLPVSPVRVTGPGPSGKMGQRKTGPCLGGEDKEPSTLPGKKFIFLCWLLHPNVFKRAALAAP